ncbi:hypothetical protein XENOCAPTIV_016321, partial [Xenoophorus captivus]
EECVETNRLQPRGLQLLSGHRWDFLPLYGITGIFFHMNYCLISCTHTRPELPLIFSPAHKHRMEQCGKVPRDNCLAQRGLTLIHQQQNGDGMLEFQFR